MSRNQPPSVTSIQGPVHHDRHVSQDDGSTVQSRALAMSVHLFTASGALWALLTLDAIMAEDYRMAFIWMFVAMFVDSVDGPLARKLDVKRHAPHIDGARLDDVIDYINYTFVPIVLLIHAGWLPDPAPLWAAFPLVASALAFSNTESKDTEDGFFLGFPSYWNVFAFYVVVLATAGSEWLVLLLMLAFSALSVMPVRFVYPNRFDGMRWFFFGGGIVWIASILFAALQYPDTPRLFVQASLVYPALYFGLSVWLDRNRTSNAT